MADELPTVLIESERGDMGAGWRASTMRGGGRIQYIQADITAQLGSQSEERGGYLGGYNRSNLILIWVDGWVAGAKCLWGFSIFKRI